MNQKKREKKYQVFISSTYEDLKEERAAVSQTLLDLGCIPVGMEQFPASDMKQMDYIKKMLETCDYYILILAGRYGSIDSEDGIGFTEKEYDYAVEKGIPVMSFLYEDIRKLPLEKSETTEEKRQVLDRFRHKVAGSKLIKHYISKEDLQTKVAVTLHKCMQDSPAIGWVRADGIDTEQDIEGMFDKYIQKHTMSKEEIDAIFNAVFTEPKVRYEPNEAGGNTVIIE